MAKKARYKAQLQETLDRFDIDRAERLIDDLVSAEKDGYVLTPSEHKLSLRLLACVDIYRRTAASLNANLE
jgi:hypothetical protein